MFEEEQKSQADFVIGCEAALKVLPVYLTQYFSSAERCLEDHELVVQVESTMASESKFLFRKNYAKYEFFKNPTNFFPEQMVTWCQQSNGSQTQLLQNFLNSSSCPEIQGFLHVKELGRKSWKKLYVCLRRSGLYCSTKGASKEPRHLQLLADLEDSRIFSLMAGRKQYGAPTDYGFCIKIPEAESWASVHPSTAPRACGQRVPVDIPPSLCLQAFLRHSPALPLAGTTCLRCLPCSGPLLWGDIGLTPWAFPRPNRVRNEAKELRLLCAEDEQSRTCWMTAFRLLKGLRIRLPTQGTRVRALVREDPTCRGATKPVRHNYRGYALEPVSHNY
ncbi:hypothetical protein J1605_013448 [Eschrichtius robustus]|uniref:Growth factor receptor-bound protein 10 n=1 Tax=Eschrichtius robustus TaxID=9764 RepID=A0AB34GGK5_ESCRO|nr:hypothetical protein J1605_013448 [Eschrichtius robustus]